MDVGGGGQGLVVVVVGEVLVCACVLEPGAMNPCVLCVRVSLCVCTCACVCEGKKRGV